MLSRGAVPSAVDNNNLVGKVIVFKRLEQVGADGKVEALRAERRSKIVDVRTDAAGRVDFTLMKSTGSLSPLRCDRAILDQIDNGQIDILDDPDTNS